MGKQILFGQSGKEIIKKGIDIVADSIKKTLGPKGKAVIIDRGMNTPLTTHDGVTIAKEINLHNNIENIGASLIKDAATKTNDIAGDGTTTVTLLTHSIITEGLKAISSGVDSTEIEKGIKEACKIAINELNKISIEIKTKEDIEHVATISCKNNELGKMIANIVHQVGKNGIINVGKSRIGKIETEITEGIRFVKGYLSPYFVNNSAKMRVELDDPYIFLTDKKLSSIADITPILKELVEKTSKKEILIIAQDIDGEALATLIINKLKGFLNPVAVKSIGYGDRMKEYLKDVAIFTGGTVISDDIGRNLDSVTIDDFGQAGRVVVDKNDTLILEGRGDQKLIDEHVENLKTILEKNLPTDFEKEKLQERLSWFLGGIGLIRVGASTESEQEELYSRVEDAVNATKAAVSEGIVPGGGVALVKVSKILEDIIDKTIQEKKNLGRITGMKIVLNALRQPVKQIVENAGENGSIILHDILLQDLSSNFGYDAEKCEYSDDLIRDGIVDPTKVVRSALENAVSVASIFLISDSIIVDVIEKNQSENKNNI